MPRLAAAVTWGRGAEPAAEQVFRECLEKISWTPAYLEGVPGGTLACTPAASDDVRAGNRSILIDPLRKVAVVALCRLDDPRSTLGVDGEGGAAALVLRAYERWGDDFPSRLRGDFAGVVWNWGEQRLVGFRDPLGVRPLYYAVQAQGVWVSDDVSTLASLAPDPGSPDEEMIVQYLLWDYQSIERTFWTKLRRLPGGHVLVATPRGTEVRRYWRPPLDEAGPRSREAVHEQLREILFRSVERRLDPGATTVAHLSGGVDSSSIICIADRLYRESPTPRPPLLAVSARYPGLACDEGPYIEAVTKRVAFPSEEWDGRSDAFPDLDAPVIAGPGQQSHRADGSDGEFPIAHRVGARVILSGSGGDHIGAPFGAPQERARRQPIRFAWRTLARRDLTLAQRFIRTRFLMRTIAPDPVRRFASTIQGMRRCPEWLQPRWRALAGDLAARAPDGPREGFRSLVQQARWRELTGARLGLSLDAEYARCSQHGVTMRYPFLDQECVEFVLRVPADLWSTENHFRLHREALADLLPSAIRERFTKAQFSAVVAHRVRLAAPRLRELFFGPIWASEPWVRQTAAQQLLERAEANQREAQENGKLQWPEWQAVRAISGLETWLRMIFRYPFPPSRRQTRQGADE